MKKIKKAVLALLTTLAAVMTSVFSFAASAADSARTDLNVNTGSKSYVVIVFIVVIAVLAGVVVYNIIKLKKNK